MAIAVRLPPILPDLRSALVRVVHVREGQRVAAGQALADVFVDLSGGYPYDCPPQAFYRLTLGEAGRIAQVHIGAGRNATVGEPIAALEPDRGDGARDAVVMVASILFHDDWWDEN